MTELEFLQEKGLIKKGYTKFEIGGDFGVFELTDLLKEYHEKQLKLCGVGVRSEQLVCHTCNEPMPKNEGGNCCSKCWGHKYGQTN